MLILIVLVSILGAYLTLYAFYLLTLLFVRYFVKSKEISAEGPPNKFVVLIPAHNEELFVSRLLDSINSQDFPRDNFRTVLVADNCKDNTAEVARDRNAIVLERFDTQKVGKGYALQYGLENTDLEQFDAVVIVDADCVLHKNVLLSFDRMLKEGKRTIQSYSGLANPDDSWFTRLLSVSQAISNEICLAAKSKLGLSIPLMGTGMCFSTDVLTKYKWDAFSVGEDWEFYAKLIKEGEIIAFAKDARVYHQESSTLKQATSQRMRWASGRFAIAWNYGFVLLFKGLIERNIVKVEASFPLLLPNPSLSINITMMGWILSLFLFIIWNSVGYLIWFSVLAIFQLIFFLVGVLYTRNKLKNFISLFAAPIFLIWKMIIDMLSALGIGRKKWVRTERTL